MVHIIIMTRYEDINNKSIISRRNQRMVNNFGYVRLLFVNRYRKPIVLVYTVHST